MECKGPWERIALRWDCHIKYGMPELNLNFSELVNYQPVLQEGAEADFLYSTKNADNRNLDFLGYPVSLFGSDNLLPRG